MLLVHRRALRSPVHLRRRDQDEALDRLLADRVEQDLRPLDVGRDELGGAVGDRLLDVRLGGRIDDHVDAADELADERRVADVAVHEREARVAEHVGEVLEVARIRERVERHDLVRGRVEQVADEVRRDEPRTTRDEYPLAHSSSSIVYSGLPSTSRWIRPSDSPISARTKPCTPSTATIPAPAKSGPGKFAFAIQYATP